jgi:hypothetical protein
MFTIITAQVTKVQDQQLDQPLQSQLHLIHSSEIQHEAATSSISSAVVAVPTKEKDAFHHMNESEALLMLQLPVVLKLRQLLKRSIYQGLVQVLLVAK